MRWNRAMMGKLIVLLLAIGAAVAAIMIVRWASDTPASSTAALQNRPAERSPATGRKFKILHIMSYHTPWEWTESQFNGFKEALSDLDVEYKVYEMDAKRRSSKEWLTQAGEEAMRIIEKWQPDLVFTDDDAVQQYVTVHYLNKDIPFVFCGVNADPKDFGFDTTQNVAGVLERMHFVQTVRLLKQIVPNVRRIAVISDNGAMWPRIISRMKASEHELEDVEIVSYDIVDTFDEYKQRVKGYEGKVDALGFLGIFELKGPDGRNVPYQEVCRWTAENSRLPDFSYWVDRVDYGTLCAVTVSGFAQGYEAGKLAREILLNGRKPSSLPMMPTVKGEPVINLARARRLGLVPSSEVLLTARVFTGYKWENE